MCEGLGETADSSLGLIYRDKCQGFVLPENCTSGTRSQDHIETGEKARATIHAEGGGKEE